MVKKYSFLQIVYKALTVIMVFFWATFALAALLYFVAGRYVYPLSHKEIVFDVADTYGLDRALVFSVIKVESGFDAKAQSRAGAIGLMQITPDTAKYIAALRGMAKFDLTDEKTNVDFGCFYLKYLYNKFDEMDTALVAYNAGEGNVILWLADEDCSRDGKTLYFIPFPESRAYLKKIKETFSKYNKLYGNILDKNQNFR